MGVSPCVADPQFNKVRDIRPEHNVCLKCLWKGKVGHFKKKSDFNNLFKDFIDHFMFNVNATCSL